MIGSKRKVLEIAKFLVEKEGIPAAKLAAAGSLKKRRRKPSSVISLPSAFSTAA